MAATTADYKVILLGDSATGKTSLIERYCSGSFKPNQPPTFGASFALKSVTFEQNVFKIGIWDTAGQEKFDCLSSFYARGASAGIICYSCVDNTCRLEHWIEKLLTESGQADPVVIICGTKADLIPAMGRQWQTEEIRLLCQKYRAVHIETSSLTGEKVVELFESTVAQMAARKLPARLSAGPKAANPSHPPRPQQELQRSQSQQKEQAAPVVVDVPAPSERGQTCC